MLRFDPTVNLGHVLILTSFLLAGITAYFAMQAGINKNSWRIDILEEVVKDQISINRQTAETLNSISRDLAVIRARSEPLEGAASKGK